jgi:hypothetical protein
VAASRSNGVEVRADLRVGPILQLWSAPELRYFELSHSQQAHQRRKIGRCGELDRVADFEINFGEDLGLRRWRPHSREKGSISSRSLVFTVGHNRSLLLQPLSRAPPAAPDALSERYHPVVLAEIGAPSAVA